MPPAASILPSDLPLSGLPDAATSRIDADDGAGRGLVFSDGRIAALGDGLLRSLGFATSDDLRGLSLASFWHPADRPAIEAAIRAARDGQPSRVTLDRGYLGDDDGTCHLALSALEMGGLILVELVAKARPSLA